MPLHDGPVDVEHQVDATDDVVLVLVVDPDVENPSIGVLRDARDVDGFPALLGEHASQHLGHLLVPEIDLDNSLPLRQSVHNSCFPARRNTPCCSSKTKTGHQDGSRIILTH